MFKDYDLFIGYTPIGDEPDFSSFLKTEGITTEVVRLPVTREGDPVAAASMLAAAHPHKKICILVPGQEFDSRGTRHGRGGGWYDRFLASVPRGWFRVGVLPSARLSKTDLAREIWDEPMDMLLIEYGDGWKVLKMETA